MKVICFYSILGDDVNKLFLIKMKNILLILSICVTQISFTQTSCKKLYTEAYRLITEGNYDKAVSKLEKALSIDTLGNCGTQFNGKVHNELGYAQMRLGNLELSRELFDKSIDLNPRNPDPRTNRAASYILENDFENALLALDEFINELPGYPLAYWQRGNIKENSGDIEAALIDYKQAKYHNSKVNLLPQPIIEQIENKLNR
ncbi:tetratricopeptide repeat protein [uncultured Dokdonia sp.]|uniref:tetratricopeptide repeat protein n=1 Tax=uncultured Dokdonia sp. TaxID=575653 RepID=UPI0026078A85|nr:tetratricopeptide repeat protein [uncultured Dokdonia sp.]